MKALYCLSLISLLAFAPSARASDLLWGKNACTSSESWSGLAEHVGDKASTEFSRFLNGRSSAARGFSEAFALRKESDKKFFAEYWMMRALYARGMVHGAEQILLPILAEPITSENAGVALAAWNCAAVIQKQVPSLTIPNSLSAKLKTIQSYSVEGMEAELELPAFMQLRQVLAGDDKNHEGDKLLALFRNDSIFGNYARALVAVKEGRHKEAAENFEKLFVHGFVASELKSYKSSILMLYAHSLFAMGRLDDAAHILQKIDRNSNDLIAALSDLSWIYLDDGKYADAIGMSISLQSGALQKTFAPDPIMVMAIALNEICQFPESLHAINIYKQNYAEVWNWLDAKKPSFATYPYYQTITHALHGEKTEVPDKVLNEWIGSPEFLARQGEINLALQELAKMDSWSASSAEEQRMMAGALLEKIRNFKKDYVAFRKKNGPKAELSTSVEASLEDLKADIVHYRNFRAVAPIWVKFVAKEKTVLPNRKVELVAAIDKSLQEETLAMREHLQDTTENIHFVEVEIFQGASRDIVWENAHPDYHAIAKKMRDDRKPASEKVWDWGKVSGGMSGSKEIWEDEIGAFKANLFDNCSSKSKYWAITKGAGR